VAAQTCAIFEARGVSDIMATYGRIGEWLPSSGYERGDGPDYEYYPPDFDPHNVNESKVLIYFPVSKA
jgi:predicted transcriptional regulator YdeE